MRKYVSIISSAFLAIVSSSVFAAGLDSETMKTIHTEIKPAFSAKCMKSMEGATQKVCDCLADQASKNLDDKMLAVCENPNTENGRSCISGAVGAATQKSLLKETVRKCLDESQGAHTTAAPVAGDKVSSATPAQDVPVQPAASVVPVETQPATTSTPDALAAPKAPEPATVDGDAKVSDTVSTDNDDDSD